MQIIVFQWRTMASLEDSNDAPVTFEDLGLRAEAATVETFVGTVGN